MFYVEQFASLVVLMELLPDARCSHPFPSQFHHKVVIDNERMATSALAALDGRDRSKS